MNGPHQLRDCRAAALLAAALLLAASGAAAQDGITVTPSFDGTRWVSAGETIELTLGAPLAPGTGRIAVLIGHTDYSALFVPDGERLIYRPRRVPLPSGEHEVTVYLVSPDNQWREVGRHPLRVLAPGGFEQVELTPRLTLNNKGQVAEGHDPATAAPARDDYQDFSLNTGFQTLNVRSGWSLRTQANFVGVSNRQEALRFGERQDDAPKFDLSDYLFTIDRGAVSLSLGHLAFGQNRHLVNGFGSRGLSAGARLGSVAQLTLAALNGNSIVGWSNPFGLSRNDHRVLGASLGLELVPGRPGLLNIELSALDGSLLPLAGFTQGVINDAEESRGGGVRVVASDPSQRVRVEAGFSRSRFTNPLDPALAQGAGVVAVDEVSRDARYVDATLSVLQGAPLAPSLPASLALTFRHERVDPLYRSVASYTRADVLQNTLELQAGLGPVSVLASHARTHDNLEAVASILTTRTRTTSVNAALPVSAIAGNRAWLPLLSYTVMRVHQFGDGVPPNSEFTPTHVPDQISLNHNIGVNWQAARWQAGYRLNLSDQDNRQLGRELADFANTTHNVTLGASPLASLSLLVDIGFETADNEEQSKQNRTRRYSASLDWRFTRTSALSASLMRTRLRDNPLTADQDVKDARVELSQRFPLLRLSQRSAPGQLFVRYNWQDSYVYNLLLPRTERSNWSVSTGITLGLF
jgi:hypothetical protein